MSVTDLETLQTHDLLLASELHRLIAQKVAAQIQKQNAGFTATQTTTTRLSPCARCQLSISF